MEVMIEHNSGVTSVFLSEDGDHIVVRYITDSAGCERDITLPADTPAFDKAVRRAKIGAAFL